MHIASMKWYISLDSYFRT